ncbi:MAG: hypothetical protein KatS3mg130_0045 [Candidatus Sumerlaea sp.]|nr:MAG: hypothetical protein KatS3mg130_0045 [Candidatus Sumerlaea sp.]
MPRAAAPRAVPTAGIRKPDAAGRHNLPSRLPCCVRAQRYEWGYAPNRRLGKMNFRLQNHWALFKES